MPDTVAAPAGRTYGITSEPASERSPRRVGGRGRAGSPGRWRRRRRRVQLDPAAVAVHDRRDDGQPQPGSAAVAPGPAGVGPVEPLEDPRRRARTARRVRRRSPPARPAVRPEPPSPARTAPVAPRRAAGPAARPARSPGPGPACAAARWRPGWWPPGAARARRRARWPARTSRCRRRSPASSTGRSGTRACASRMVSAAISSRSTGRSAGSRSLVQAGQQQQVLDQHGHPAGLALDPAHRLVELRAGRRAAAPVQLGEAADRGQRGAQLVRGVRDELPQPLLGRGTRGRPRPRSGTASGSAPCRAGRARCAGRCPATRPDRLPAEMSAATRSIAVSGRSPSRTTNAASAAEQPEHQHGDRGVDEQQPVGGLVHLGQGGAEHRDAAGAADRHGDQPPVGAAVRGRHGERPARAGARAGRRRRTPAPAWSPPARCCAPGRARRPAP